MPRYVIERKIPGAGKLTEKEVKDISKKSCSVIEEMHGAVQWEHSYVTGDKIYCVYIAKSEADVRDHAKRGGFPADSVAQVRHVMDPTSAE